MNPINQTAIADVQGVLIQPGDSQITLGLVGTDYQLHLRVDHPVPGGGQPDQRLVGTIHAQAKRVDVIRSGGRYIEPVYGQPRRLQGMVMAVDLIDQEIIVDCACRFVCRLMKGQSPGEIPIGALVSFDVESGARFQPSNT